MNTILYVNYNNNNNKQELRNYYQSNIQEDFPKCNGQHYIWEVYKWACFISIFIFILITLEILSISNLVIKY